ncbi:hypothetical protein L7F22_023212 [Adiantum nelumboides]|nr:hypothetical protein [Adiantum nelumboides]
MFAAVVLVALCGGMEKVKLQRLTERGLVAGVGVVEDNGDCEEDDTSNGVGVCAKLLVLEGESGLLRRFKEGQALQEPSVRIGRVRVLPYLLADSGYGACWHLITPFREGHPPAIRDWRAFNRHLSKSRVRIEHVFGLLKNRWRILKDINVDLQRVPKYIVACCVLHNILIESTQEEPREEDYDPHPNFNNEVYNATTSERTESQDLRDAVYLEWSRRAQVL